MTAEDLARALEIARTAEPPQRQDRCRNGHDPQYSYLGGYDVRQWRCSLCRLEATGRRKRRTQPPNLWHPGRADLRVMKHLRRIPNPVERLRIALDAWREITG